MALGFVVLERKKIILTQGFEHVKEYAGFAAGKPRVCSEHVFVKVWRDMGVMTPSTVKVSHPPMKGHPTLC
jgi:hypothetical protein